MQRLKQRNRGLVVIEQPGTVDDVGTVPALPQTGHQTQILMWWGGSKWQQFHSVSYLWNAVSSTSTERMCVSKWEVPELCVDTDRPNEQPKWMDVHLVFSIPPTAKISTTRKYNSKQKKLSLKEKSIPQIRNTLRGIRNAISVTQPVTLCLALEPYVEMCFLIVTVSESCALLLGSIWYRQW